jgi:beta-glucanase (GH16 family)
MSASRAGRRLAVAAVLSALLLPALATGPADAATPGKSAAVRSAQAAKKPKSSWSLRSTVKFSGSTLPTGCGPYTGKYTAGDSAWSSKDVAMSKGLLKLKLEKRKTSGQPYSSGAIGCWDWSQTYGKFEIKAKAPVGKGIDSYITLSPNKVNKVNALTSLELLAPGPDTAYVNNGNGTKSELAQAAGSYGGAYHTYVIEWAPKHLRITVDGTEIFWSTNSYKGSRWISLVTSNGDTLTGVPDAATTLPATFQIDEMKIYKYTGIAPAAGTTADIAVTPTPTPAPSATAANPDASAQARAARLKTVSDSQPVLAGGVWPWLLGGSLIAACAAGILSQPGRRWSRRVHDHHQHPH